jgi:dipeptidyl aminopeptidase/acylaminoacyl peptidase
LLKNPYDEALFDYYFASQMLLVNADDGKTSTLGRLGAFTMVDPAPGGRYFLVSTLTKPFPWLLTVSGFPRRIEVWGLDGKVVAHIADVPSQEGVPIEGVITGPRSHRWRSTADATLVWAEALDGGDPKTKAPHRDKLMALPAPFQESAREVLRLEHRFAGLTWGEKEGLALISDYDRDRRWTRTFLTRLDRSQEVPKVIWDRSVRDRYGDPGEPLLRTLPNGERVIWQTGDTIYLSGGGASPAGDFPFLDRFNLETLKTERVFRCADGSYESAVAIMADSPDLAFMTRHETPASPPNYVVRTGGSTPLHKAVTQFPDPTPQVRAISRQLVTYQRADGVPLSFTLYLPAGYQRGTRLPTVVWAYPLEFNDAATAGQVSGSTNRFTTLLGPTHLFFLTQGYAVLDSATMPIVGSPETMNDTFIDQIVTSARAAIDQAVAMGVTDPERVGVGGHSYGAFMTANLLAHSRLFRAGIARSGAYNRTLTPFGFQGERRTFWEAPEIYSRLSPFNHAAAIKDPILLIHGENDDNDGTFPIQSQRLYQAIKGNGGNVRYVTLPHEAHGYAARQSIEHTLYEMLTWFDTHVKHAPPREAKPGSAQ